METDNYIVNHEVFYRRRPRTETFKESNDLGFFICLKYHVILCEPCNKTEVGDWVACVLRVYANSSARWDQEFDIQR